MTHIYGIDVSSNQPKSICKSVSYDFAIVKIGGNPHGYAWDYQNPFAQTQLDDAYKRCGCVGGYWFLYGKSATKEADTFVDAVKRLGYLGKCVLAADYEADALKKGAAWLKQFCERVTEKAGYKPIIYASGSVIESQKLRKLGYELWCANYYLGDKRINGYNTKGMKKYIASAKLWQFTENGYLDGYSGRLDLNRFDGTKSDWLKLTGQKKAKAPKYQKYVVRVNTALNFRAEPSTKAEITRARTNGRVIYVDKIKNGWAHTQEGDWCSAKYIERA